MNAHTNPYPGFRSVAFVLPIQTKSLANLRWHWARKAKLAAEQRGIVLLALRGLCRPFRLPEAVRAPKARPGGRSVPAMALLEVTLTRIAPRELDDDNLRGALKSVRDGVADCLGVDDRDKRVAWLYEQRRGRPKEYAVSVQIRVPDCAKQM